MSPDGSEGPAEGLGREGIRFAMEDVDREIRNLVIRHRDEGPSKRHMGA